MCAGVVLSVSRNLNSQLKKRQFKWQSEARYQELEVFWGYGLLFAVSSELYKQQQSSFDSIINNNNNEEEQNVNTDKSILRNKRTKCTQ